MALQTRTRRLLLAGVVLVAIVTGAVAAVSVPGGIGDDSEPHIAVVELHGSIDETNAAHVEDSLREARMNDSIDGAVLEVNSNGGLPAESERIRSAVAHTTEEIPVIATVDTSGASGGYLSMVAADEIYAAPSAQTIGSVGVTGEVAPPLTPDEGATGPNKGQIHPDDSYARSEMLSNLFADAVLEDRGDEITFDRGELMRADVYLGVEAVENGLVDELGHTDRAVENIVAAEGLGEYDVTRFEANLPEDPLGIGFLENEDGEQVPYATNVDAPIGAHLALYPGDPIATDTGGASR